MGQAVARSRKYKHIEVINTIFAYYGLSHHDSKRAKVVSYNCFSDSGLPFNLDKNLYPWNGKNSVKSERSLINLIDFSRTHQNQMTKKDYCNIKELGKFTGFCRVALCLKSFKRILLFIFMCLCHGINCDPVQLKEVL
jgi:hypothetical protein